MDYDRADRMMIIERKKKKKKSGDVEEGRYKYKYMIYDIYKE